MNDMPDKIYLEKHDVDKDKIMIPTQEQIREAKSLLLLKLMTLRETGDKEEIKAIEVNKVILFALRLAEKMQWRTIDSAPKGVWILIQAYGVVMQSCWNANGYWETFNNNRVYEAEKWMPLPEIPKGNE